MRPSCGSRRSAMSSWAMILMRETMAAISRAGGPLPRAARRHTGSGRAAGPRTVRCGCRRRSLHGARDDLVDQADHRRFARQIAQAFGIVLGGGIIPGNTHLTGRSNRRIEPVERGLQLDRHRHFRHDRHTGGGTDCGGYVSVERIDDCDDQLAIFDGKRQRPGRAQEWWRKSFRTQGRGFRVAFRRDDPQVEQVSIGLRQRCLAQQAKLDQHRVEPLPGLLREPGARVQWFSRRTGPARPGTLPVG